jgi:5-aminolevulinate synthase
MDSVLRQSKAMCPFLKKASPATLRALSTATRPKTSPCGGTISKLQLLGQRCPVMGKALAVQSAKYGHSAVTGAVAITGIRAFSGHQKPSRAKIHTSRVQEARAVESPLFNGDEKSQLAVLYCIQDIF